VEALLQRERAARLVDFHRRDGSQPGLELILGTLIDRVFEAHQNESPRLAEIRRVTQTATVAGLIELASDPDAAPEVRSRLEAALNGLRARLGSSAGLSSEDAVHRAMLDAAINRHMERAAQPIPLSIGAPAPPPGDPI
jgi:hypothetical protein